MKKEQTKQFLEQWGLPLAAGFATFLLVKSLILEKYFFQLRRYDIGNGKGHKKLRLVLLTDFHFQKVFWPYHARLARQVNALRPDLILITGDTLDDNGRPGPVHEFLRRLDPHCPKVAIPGNHDYLSPVPVDELKSIYRQYNGDLLINETRTYTVRGEKLVITGLDDHIEGSASLEDAVRETGREVNHLLLIHSPLLQEQALADLERINREREEKDRIRLQYIFAGHNHGGQIRFFGYAPILPVQSGNYVDGWYNDEVPYLYVSRGIGTSGLPFRLGARSEVTVFDYFI